MPLFPYEEGDTVIFEGGLKVIDMSREIENDVKTIIHDSHAYVPAESFEKFFNEVIVSVPARYTENAENLAFTGLSAELLALVR